VFQWESVFFALCGLGYLFMPGTHSQLLFGDRLLKSSEPFVHQTMAALGCLCLLTASIFCTAADNATKEMSGTTAAAAAAAINSQPKERRGG